MMKTNDDRGPDDICGEQESPLGLRVKLLDDDGYDHFALVSGSREALNFLASIISAVSRSEKLPAHIQMSPSGAGNFHFSEDSNMGIYIECVQEDQNGEPPVTAPGER
jgi:hypothetical protein